MKLILHSCLDVKFPAAVVHSTGRLLASACSLAVSRLWISVPLPPESSNALTRIGLGVPLLVFSLMNAIGAFCSYFVRFAGFWALSKDAMEKFSLFVDALMHSSNALLVSLVFSYDVSF